MWNLSLAVMTPQTIHLFILFNCFAAKAKAAKPSHAVSNMQKRGQAWEHSGTISRKRAKSNISLISIYENQNKVRKVNNTMNLLLDTDMI